MLDDQKYILVGWESNATQHNVYPEDKHFCVELDSLKVYIIEYITQKSLLEMNQISHLHVQSLKRSVVYRYQVYKNRIL